MKHKMERRFVKGVKVRAKDGDTPQLSGYASTFGDDYVLYDSASYRVVERIKAGAFSRVLSENQDVRCLFNHEPDNVLGRTTNGTLRMKQDDKGLQFENDLDTRTSIAQNVQAFIDRGDVSGCSFAFTVSKQNWSEETVDQKTIHTREIEEFDNLYDVGPVTYPAYESTSVGARSWLAAAPAELRSKMRDAQDGDPEPECNCGCRACMSAECDECEMHMADCGDPDTCDHDGDVSSYSRRGDDTPTKRVAGEDLPASSFLWVGDPEKPATWSLPWKFSTTAKTKSHLRNALARFSSTKKVPDDKKPAVYKKLVQLCKKYGIKVTDDEAKAMGLNDEQRKMLRGDAVGSTDNNCECSCAECQVGDCENCSDPECDDPDCEHEDEGVADDGQQDDEEYSRAAALEEVDTRIRLAGLHLVKP